MTVGITGHREVAVPAGALDGVPGVLAAVFDGLSAGVQRLADEGAMPFSGQEPYIELHSPMATGADQMAVAAARAAGVKVRA
ncbi:MAG: hypothetical protein WA906_11550, partial [Pacificimonas sp.]